MMMRRAARVRKDCFRLLAATLVVAAVHQASVAAEGEQPVTLRGHVLLPDGKPAKGAGLYWVQFKAPPPRKPGDAVFEKRAATDDEGRFEFSLMEHDAPLDQVPRPVLAHKPGFGLAWLGIVRGEVPPDATLRLVDDRPIRGRMTDTEGRPVGSAKVAAGQVRASADGRLDGFLAAWKKNWQQTWNGPDADPTLRLYIPPGSFLDAVTDKDGRFELSGLGDERLVSLNFSAPGCVSEGINVVNRDGFDAAEYNELAAANTMPRMFGGGRRPRLTGPEFDLVVEAELVIRGHVFKRPDRTPVAGAYVSSSGQGAPSIVTDAKGHFELRGLRRAQEALLNVRASADNLLPRTLRLDVAPGQTVVGDVDVELTQGLVVEGRVFDKAMGRGVRSGVQFVALPGNDYVDQPGYDQYKNVRETMTTDDEGRFRVLVIPGPGVLMARVQPGRPRIDGNKPSPYRQASFSEEDAKHVPITVNGDDRSFTARENRIEFLMSHNAVKFIDLAPDSGPVRCDLPLNPGKTVKLAIADEQGEPLADAFVAGVADSGPSTFKIAEPNCTIYGLGTDRPRHLCIFHPERRLAASFMLTGEEPGPVTVRLTAPASIVGRALDPEGEPLADAIVQVNYMSRNASALYQLMTTDVEPIKTDDDGRFSVEDIVPGERLVLGFKQEDAYFYIVGLTDEKRQLESGQKLELGDAKAKQVR